MYGKNDRSTKEVLLQDSSYSYDEEDDSSVEEAAFIETKWDRRQHKNGTSKYPKRQWEVGRSRKKLKKYYKDVHELQEKMSALDQNELSSTDKPAAVREEIDVTKKTILKNRTIVRLTQAIRCLLLWKLMRFMPPKSMQDISKEWQVIPYGVRIWGNSKNSTVQALGRT